MTARTSKTTIGAFVVGGILLLIGGVVFFGGGRFFEPTYDVVMRFEGSAVGLKLGAPVIINGVEVGKVTDITLEMDLETLKYVTSVRAVLGTNVAVVGTEEEVRAVHDRRGHLRVEAARGLLDALVEKGMRAQLTLQSFVTGLMQIELKLHPQAPPATLVRLEDGAIEVPTVPSEFDRIVQVLQDFPFEEAAEQLRQTLAGIEGIVNGPDLHEGIERLASLAAQMDASFEGLDGELKGTLQDARQLMTDLDREYTPLAKEASAVLEDIRRLTQSLDAQVEPVGTRVSATLDDTRSLLRNELAATLAALARASDQLRELTSYLERHPEALLKGKPD